MIAKAIVLGVEQDKSNNKKKRPSNSIKKLGTLFPDLSTDIAFNLAENPIYDQSIITSRLIVSDVSASTSMMPLDTIITNKAKGFDKFR